MLVYLENGNKWINEEDAHPTIVSITCGIIEFGYDWWKYDTAMFQIGSKLYQGDIEKLKDYFKFSEQRGLYVPINEYNEQWDGVKGTSEIYPYTFKREYEAFHNLNMFAGKQVLNKDNYKEYWAAKYLEDRTFGLEFETSCGFIPQEECFKNGLIPLRDGSITGLEYTTVVLKGNDGLNMLHQQLEQLKKHCEFDKECSLHIHFGNFPVKERKIFILYNVALLFEKAIKKYVPKYTFRTRLYKASRKDYCKELKYKYQNFKDLYRAFANQPYFGNLFQPHPNDIERIQKWRISTRYYWLNLINMLCYDGPKTVEFRLLRPSFDEKKIIYWMLLLNCVLKYSCRLAELDNDMILKEFENFTLLRMITSMFDKKDAKQMKLFLKDLKTGVSKQTEAEDYYGSRIDLEDYSDLTI